MNKVVILINLGSPTRCDLPSVKKYLRQFLMDPNVIDINFFLRYILINFLIVPFRSPKTLGAYQEIWNKEKDLSPLIATTAEIANKLNNLLHSQNVLYAMSYQQPSIMSQVNYAINTLKASKIFFIPMYPHYAMSTVKTVQDEIHMIMKKHQVSFQIKDIFYNDPEYIEALFDQYKKNLQFQYEHLIFSYHGLPVRHLKKTDPTSQHCYKSDNCCKIASEAHRFCYKHQVIQTTELLVEKLKIPTDQYSIVYQSRLGRDEWIRPSLTEEVSRLKQLGIKKLAIMCPSFVTDCLETLEEVNIGIREMFLEGNPESEFQMIPCLNTNQKWLLLLKKWIDQSI